jgi:predicted extracellular nuclease
MKKIITIIAIAMCFVMAANLTGASNAAQAAVPTELYFSEYIEGSSYNKALEIYNGTGATVNLATDSYSILMSFNGGTSTYTINLTGSVANGDVYVVGPTNATDPTILAQADQLQGTAWFNGDDAVVLRKGDTVLTVLDVIGQIGFDPGTEWGSGLTSTADNTLRRMDTICTGDPDGYNPFDPSIEWIGYANNTFDGLGTHVANCAPSTLEPKLNEFSASTVGTDVEWVEVFGSTDTDYSAYTILEIEGDTTGAGVVDEVIPVGTTDAGGFWLQNLAANALENGTLSLLLVKDFTGALGDDLDTNNDGVFDITPWSALADGVSVNDGGTGDFTYGTPSLGVGYDGLPYAPGGASRYPDGYDTDADTDWVRNDFDLAGIPGYAGTIILGEAYNTPGAPNQIYVPPPEACGDPFTPIYQVQGSGLTSPLVGTEVALEGIVVGDFQNNAEPDNGNLNGFHVQDSTGDGDAATSDGVFIYAPGAADVLVGDGVRVRGMVSEYNGMTEVTVSQLWICSGGNSVAPTIISLPVTSLDDFEPFEGMLVTIPQALYISEYFNFDRYGEIMLTSDRHYTPTAIYDPGSPEQAALAEAHLLSRITLDDGRSTQNPDPALHPNGYIFDMDNLFRGGDMVANVTGVLDYSFSLYRIQPTQGADYFPMNLRTSAPDDVGGNLKVASFNLLNYFTTIDTGAFICGPAGDQECRGADTAEEFTRQRDKFVAALTTMNADVVGLIEIENYPGDVPTADLVSGLNDVLGAGTYNYIATGAIGTDAIRVAMIYKPATVTPVGAYAILDSSVDPRFLDDYNRPVLAQTFQDNLTGGIFTVAVNHLKSKGSDCGAVGDPDLGDGAGNCNLTRMHAAEALVDWLASDPTNSGDADALIIGDLNSYDKEDPIDSLTAGGYTDLLGYFQGEYAYTYVFDGQLGYLDYALANADLLDEITGVTAWHINADEPDLIDYDMSFKLDPQDALYAPDAYRASDHDPVNIGLNVCDEIPPTLAVSVSPDFLWPPKHQYITVAATVEAWDNFDPNPTITLVSVTSNEPDDGLGDGDTPIDIVIMNEYTFLLRAERSGLGIGRFYTITYQVTDACGNSTLASAIVNVPHDYRR